VDLRVETRVSIEQAAQMLRAPIRPRQSFMAPAPLPTGGGPRPDRDASLKAVLLLAKKEAVT